MVTNPEKDENMAGANETFSVRMPLERKSELDELAERIDRSRSWLINEAVRQYLEIQRRQIAIIEERLAEMDSGQVTLIPHDEVVQRQEERLKAKLGLL
jgi:predicted transcriptional regulator